MPIGSKIARGILFRSAPLLALLILLAALEIGLRLGGYGFSGEYLETRDIQGVPHWVSNRSFFHAFFPPNLVPHAEPLAVPVRKAPGTLRLIVMGESAALGTPDPDFGFARILDRMLDHRYPDLDFEIVNVSATAINSHVLADMSRQLAKLEPDLFIVYAGNNEVVGPYGPGTVFAPFLAEIHLVRAGIFLRRTRVGQLFLEGWRHVAWKLHPPQRWAGLQMFRERAIAPNAPCLAPVYSHFRRNLEDIVSDARGAGARVILCTMASNLRDFAPLASLPPAGTGADSLMADRRFEEARIFLALGRDAEAFKGFAAARDLDALRFRADSRINTLLRGLAAANSDRGARLAEVEGAFRDQSPHGLPGHELFFEQVHMTFSGNHLLARTVMNAVDSALIETGRIEAIPTDEVLDEEVCRRQLGLTGWNRLGMAGKIRTMLAKPPFSTRPDARGELALVQASIDSLREFETAARFEEVMEEYRQALDAFPDDPILHKNLGEYLFALDALPQASGELWTALRLRPRDGRTRQMLAQCLAGQGRLAEATEQYRIALDQDPELPELHNGLGNILSRQGDHSAAIGQYQLALEMQPNLPEVYFNLGRSYAEQDRTRDAVRCYRQALALDPAFRPAAKALETP